MLSTAFRLRFTQFRKKDAGDCLARQQDNLSEAQKAAQEEGAAKRKKILEEQKAAAAADIGAQDMSGLKKMLNRKCAPHEANYVPVV